MNDFDCDLIVGQLVRSKKGRDKGRIYIIIKIVGCAAYLADGDLRKIEKPKKKNIKHIYPLDKYPRDRYAKIKDGLINETVKNKNIKQIIDKYKRADR